jgi:hypothetical protein
MFDPLEIQLLPLAGGRTQLIVGNGRDYGAALKMFVELGWTWMFRPQDQAPLARVLAERKRIKAEIARSWKELGEEEFRRRWGVSRKGVGLVSLRQLRREFGRSGSKNNFGWGKAAA